MRVVVACEFSGIVRDAFRALGHEAISVDLLPSERPGPHLQTDIREVRLDGFDLMVAFPPCTYLAGSGARWWPDQLPGQYEALALVRFLLESPVPRIALENPVGLLSSKVRKPDQIIQPWEYGHGEVKGTCLWLKNLPKLRPTHHVEGRHPRVHRMGPSPDRWRERSRTLPGVAQAMATQWGTALPWPYLQEELWANL